MPKSCPIQNVCEIIDPHSLTWSLGPIENIISDRENESIQKIPLSLLLPWDSPIWNFYKKENFLIKTTYNHLAPPINHHNNQLPIWKKTLASKNPP